MMFESRLMARILFTAQALGFLLNFNVAGAFAFQGPRPPSATTTHLNMAPQYDPFSRRWEASSPEESAEAGYPPVGSLIRQGPIPFLQRLKDPDMYDQAVLKMMANSEENMSRDEAQGNMDAYMKNPNDWALQKMEEKNGGEKFEYANANMDDDSLILTGAWAGILLAFVGRIGYVSAFGCDNFCRQYHW